MNKDKIKDIIKEVFVEVLDLEIPPDALIDNHLIEEYGLNSVDALEILMHLEKRLNVEVDEEDLTADLVNSIDELSSYLLNKLSSADAV